MKTQDLYVIGTVVLVALVFGWLIWGVGGSWGDRAEGFLAGAAAIVAISVWYTNRNGVTS